ncbi:MAG TPA: zf-HC2 domain-containing protein [Candidatus Tumulicola sp.]|nr:zf-HC2 domain-containing protein [Candidatus Tumulicola sp.]
MNQTHLTTEQLVDYVHGGLPPAQDASVHAHLSGCPTCTEAHDAELRLSELLRAHARAEELELPPGLTTAIYARTIDAPAPQRGWLGWRAALRPAAAVPVAAVLALAVYFVSSGWHANAKGGALDAAYYMDNHAALSTTMPFAAGEAFPAQLTADEMDR